MKAHEIVESASGGASAGATTAGSMAPMATTMGMITRNGGNLLSGKYTTDPTPNTPKEYKRKKSAR
jgi:hypothetical protein